MERQNVRRMPKVMQTSGPIRPAADWRLARWLFWVVVIMGCAYGVYWAIWLNPYFAIKTVEVDGVASPVVKEAAGQLAGQNIFRLQSSDVAAMIRSVYPPTESVTLVRGLPNTVKLEVTLRTPAALWQVGGTSYVVDTAGIVYAVADPSLGPLPATKITDATNLPISLGRQITTPAFLSFVSDLSTKLPEATGKQIQSLQIKDSSFYVDVITTDNKQFKLTTLRDEDQQIEEIRQVLLAKLGNVGYIDVRVPGRAYYK